MVSETGSIPSSIRPILDFLNSVDLRTYGPSRGLLDRDQLAEPAAAKGWLEAQGIEAPEGAASTEITKLREIRERLRAAVAAEGDLSLNGSVVLTIDRESVATVGPGRDGRVSDAIAAHLIRVALSPEYQRLRVCDAEDCRRAFYDTSRNGRSRWCSMKTCGNRMKTRSYRQRNQGGVALTASASRSLSKRRERTNTFRREGDYWTIASAGRRFRLKDSKGLRYLARLLAEPHREFHVMDIVGPGATAAGPGHGAKASYALLDDDARRAYKARVAVLEAEIEGADSSADGARVSRAREEMQFIADELQRATGIGGRDRSFSTDSERARVSVTRVIKAALNRIADESPELKHHFASTIRTGTYCSYSPDPRLPVRWEL